MTVPQKYREHGYNAYNAGQSMAMKYNSDRTRVSNPYISGTTNHRAWEDGFKSISTHKNPQFIHNGRNFEDAVNKAINKAKSEAAYPSSSSLLGIKQMLGERAVFNIVIEGELKKARVPKALIKRLMKP